MKNFMFFVWRFSPSPGHGLPLRGFAITLIGHTTLVRTPLGELWVWRRNLYLTTHDTHKRQTSVSMLDLNPQPQQASDYRPTPKTAQPLGSVKSFIEVLIQENVVW